MTEAASWDWVRQQDGEEDPLYSSLPPAAGSSSTTSPSSHVNPYGSVYGNYAHLQAGPISDSGTGLYPDLSVYQGKLSFFRCCSDPLGTNGSFKQHMRPVCIGLPYKLDDKPRFSCLFCSMMHVSSVSHCQTCTFEFMRVSPTPPNPRVRRKEGCVLVRRASEA